MSTNQNWTATDATIFSADYLDPGGRERPCWRVTYSYKVDGEFYSGEFVDFATDSEADYHKDDKLQIEYSMARPDKSRVPGAVTYWSKARIPFAIGAALGLAALVIYIVTHSR